jgi:hypothetical protein
MEEASNLKESRKYYLLKFSFIWTLIFSIAGIVIHYFSSESPNILNIITGFFSSDYVNWFANFANFADAAVYPTSKDFIYALFGEWYYFFYTGGLISIIWALITLLFNLIFKGHSAKNLESKQINSEASSSSHEGNSDLDDWINAGIRLLSENNLEEAEMIYEQAKRAYNPAEDKNQKIYRRILDFYHEIIEKRNSS